MGEGRTKWLVGAALAAASALTIASVGVSSAQSAPVDTSPPPAANELTVTVERTANRLEIRLTVVLVADDTAMGGYDFFVNGNPIGAIPPFGDPGTPATLVTSAALIDLPLIAQNYFFQVQSFDLAGNRAPRSAPVRVYIDPRPPSAPTEVSLAALDGANATLRFIGSRDDSSITAYRVINNGEQIDELDAAELLDDGARIITPPVALPEHVNFVQLVGVDSFGNTSVRSRPVRVIVGPDTTPPSAPRNLATTDGRRLTWSTATDNVAVVGYVVIETSSLTGGQTEYAVPFPTFSIPPSAAARRWYQIVAVDEAGNRSVKTPPLLISD